MAIDQEIIEQLEQVRADGRTNMLESHGVQHVANALELHDLVLWVEDNRKNASVYMQALEAMGNQRKAVE